MNLQGSDLLQHAFALHQNHGHPIVPLVFHGLQRKRNDKTIRNTGNRMPIKYTQKKQLGIELCVHPKGDQAHSINSFIPKYTHTW